MTRIDEIENTPQSAHPSDFASGPNADLSFSGMSLSNLWPSLRILTIALVCFAAALVGIEWTREAGNVAALWPPNAVLLAALSAAGERQRAVLFATGCGAIFLANFVFGDPVAVSFGLALANGAEVGTGLYLLSRHAGRQLTFGSLRKTARLLLLAGVAAPIVGATAGAAVIHLSFGSSYWSVWQTWWLADALGVLIFLPLASYAFGGVRADLVPVSRLIEAPILGALLCVILWFGLFGSSLISILALPPALIWISMRSGFFGASLATAGLGLLLTTAVVKDLGPIGEIGYLTDTDKILHLQVALTVLALPVLVIASVLAQERSVRNALSESERRYRTLYNLSPAMLHATDAEGRLISVSHFWLETLGYLRDEVIGRPVTDFLTSDSLARVQDKVLPSLRNNGAIRNIELSFLNKDGGAVEVLLSATPERSAKGQTGESLFVMTDITERKALERKLADMVTELERSNHDLEQFAYHASHDLQEPLRMVSSFTQLLDQRYGAGLDQKARTYIYHARKGAERMSRLVNDLLAYSRIRRNHGRPDTVDLNMAVSAATANLKSCIDENSALITHSTLPVVNGDRSQLISLLQNLIGNAIKYRGADAPKVEVSACRNGRKWCLTVEDNGLGIDPKHHARIFEVFTRLHRREKYEGTGIGLAVCQRIIEAHNGSIWVESKPGRGSRFHFELPAAEKEEQSNEGA